MAAGLKLGIGNGLWGNQTSSGDGAVGSALVFPSPITGDQVGLSANLSDFPSVWVIAGAFAVMVFVYAHWLAY